MQQLVSAVFGFSVADADVPDVHFAEGNLIITFKDWRERSVEHRFLDVLAFRWATTPSYATPREDSTFELRDSDWLQTELHRDRGLATSDFAHYILCFNASSTLEVICRRMNK